MLSTASGVTDALPWQLFHARLFNFFRNSNAPTQTNGSSVCNGPTVANGDPKTSLHEQTDIRASTRVKKFARSNANSAESDTSAVNGKEKEETIDIVGALHYKPSTNKELQVQHHGRIRQCETAATNADRYKKLPYPRNTMPTKNRSLACTQSSSS